MDESRSHVFIFGAWAECVSNPFNRILKPNSDANVELIGAFKSTEKLFPSTIAETNWGVKICAFLERLPPFSHYVQQKTKQCACYTHTHQQKYQF